MLTKPLVALSVVMVGWFAPITIVGAQVTSASGELVQAAPLGAEEAEFPYVNSGGLRLRDFPSVTDGRILATLNQGVRLKVSAATEWKDNIGGGKYPWYRVSTRDGSDRTGWVYGEYVSFQPNYSLDFWHVQRVSRHHMNRPLLVLQMFRRLLGTETQEVPDSWLRGLPLVAETKLYQNNPTEYSLRTYKTDFGRIVVRYNAQDRLELVLAISVDRPVRGLLLSVGDPTARAQELFGSDYFLQGGSLIYRASPDIDTYGVTIQIENGRVVVLKAGVIVQ